MAYRYAKRNLNIYLGYAEIRNPIITADYKLINFYNFVPILFRLYLPNVVNIDLLGRKNFLVGFVLGPELCRKHL